MRFTRRFALGMLTIVTLLAGEFSPTFGPSTLAAAATETPAKVIVQVPESSLSELVEWVASIGVEPTATYTQALSGLAASLTDSQVTQLKSLIPEASVTDDVTVSIDTTQDAAPWNLSSLDQTSVPADDKYVYPSSAGSGIKVYVIDTGVAANTAQLGSRLIAGRDFTSSGSTSDCNGHGTHVAGTIASSAYGVAKQAKIVPLKVLDYFGTCIGSGSTSNVLAAIDWAISDNLAGTRAVINMSLGSSSLSSSAAMTTAINNAIADGIVVVVAAGNETTDACQVTPALTPAAITVGAVDSTFKEATFSNYGDCVDIFAPGVNIYSLDIANLAGSKALSGTSMAAPHVAGAAALYLGLHPTATPAQVSTAILENAESSKVTYNDSANPSANKLLDISGFENLPTNNTPPIITAVVGTLGADAKPRFVAPGSIGTTTRLNVSDGSWSNRDSAGASYQWFSCDSITTASQIKPSGCTEIAGATASSFTVTESSVEKSVVAAVTVTGSSASATHYSASSAVVGQAALKMEAPEISGSPSVGATLSASTGIWAGSPNQAYRFQWYSCGEVVLAAPSALPAGCVALSGQTASDFEPTRAQLDKHILVRVQASNSSMALTDLVYAYSASTSKVSSAPWSITSPILTIETGSTYGANGAPRYVAERDRSTTLKVTDGTWAGSATMTFSYQWYSCDSPEFGSDSQPSSCQELVGETGSTFTVAENTVGKYLVARVRVSNTQGFSELFTSSSAAVTSSPFATVLPSLEVSEVEIGRALSALRGTWEGLPTPALATRWWACRTRILEPSSVLDSAAGCTLIAGQSGQEFTPGFSQLGKFIVSEVYATNDATGSASPVSAYSASSVTAVAAAPTLSAAPLGNGSNVRFVATKSTLNTKFTAVLNSWPAATGFTYQYQWFRCDRAVSGSTEAPEGCSQIVGASANSYLVGATDAADVGKFISVRITASKAGLEPQIRFVASYGQVMQVPKNSAAPSVTKSGADYGFTVGRDLIAEAGTWSALPESTFTYRWFSCSTAVTAGSAVKTGCVLITGQTAQNFTVTSTQKGKYLVAEVTATNAVGSAKTYSASSPRILELPRNTAVPTTSTTSVSTTGAPISGTTMTVKAGTWATTIDATVKSYQWFACDSAIATAVSTVPADCTEIPGARSSTLTLGANLQGKFVSASVTGRNTAGSVSVLAVSTKAVVAKPIFATDPQLAGSAISGESITASVSVDPASEGLSTEYQWFSCSIANSATSALPATCAPIGGAVSNAYVLATRDEAKYVTVRATLTNEAGSVVRYSASTTVIEGIAKLVSMAAPKTTISPLKIGGEVTADQGSWTGHPVPTFSYQWYRCSPSLSATRPTLPSECDLIEGAAEKTYLATSSDVGKYLTARVRASNSIGQTEVWSKSGDQVYEAPSFLGEPSLADLRVVGEIVTASPGETSGLPSGTSRYQWYRCSVQHEATQATIPTNCALIIGAPNTESYTLQTADLGKFVAAYLTISNPAGSAKRMTKTTRPVISSPSISPWPTVAGGVWADSTLTANATATGTPTPTLEYSWYKCEGAGEGSGEAPAGCFEIPGASGPSYALTEGDAGSTIRVKAIASNEAQPDGVVAFSKAYGPVKIKPTNTGAPMVAGSDVVGQSLFATEGSWAGSAPIRYSYQWFACSGEQLASAATLPAGCAAIASATSTNFLQTSAQVGKHLLVRVSAANGTVDASIFSATRGPVASLPKYVTSTKTMKVTIPAGQGSKTGAPRVGSLVTASVGTWTGSPAPTFDYQWFSCAVSKATASREFDYFNCVDILGATSSTFTVTSSQVSKYLGFRVVGSNKASYEEWFSPTTAKAVVSLPENTRPQTISGYPYVDAKVGTVAGAWVGTPTPTLSAKWWLCASAITEPTTAKPADCVAQTSTTAELSLTAAMEGKHISRAVKASNDAGDLTLWSVTKGPIVFGAINVVAPKVSLPTGRQPDGSAIIEAVDVLLTASTGTWKPNSPTTVEKTVDVFTYQWYSCEAKVTVASQTLTDGCAALDGELAGTYSIRSDDYGNYLLVGVTGENDLGASTTFSASTNMVNRVPENIKEPELIGRAFVGDSMTAQGTVDDWIADPAPSISHQWLACDSQIFEIPVTAPTGCVAISGATSATFKSTTAQIGKFLVVRITAKNAAGSTPAWSISSEVVESGPVIKTAPKITNVDGTVPTPLVGTRIKTDGGQWLGNPTPTTTYQWLRCEIAVAKDSANDPGYLAPVPPAIAQPNCVFIVGATSDEYVPVAEDRGKYLMVKVTANNGTLDSVHYSATSSVVNMAPVIKPETAASVTGAAFSEGTVKAKNDEWLAHPAPTKTYAWYLCESQVEAASGVLADGCDLISGSTSAKFVVPAGYLDKYLVAKTVASNPFGVAETYSISSPKITTGPVNKVAPVQTGIAKFVLDKVQKFTITDGSWVGTPTSALTFQWYRCKAVVGAAADELASGCELIEGATANQYVLGEEDSGSALMGSVTGTNEFGTSTAFAKSSALITELVKNVAHAAVLSVPKVDQAMTVSDGEWRGYPAPTIKRLWYRCAKKVAAPSFALVATNDCKAISTATRNTFTPSETMVGSTHPFLIYSVTETNKVDGVVKTITSFSASTDAVAQPPVHSGRPTLSTTADGANDVGPRVKDVWSIGANWQVQKPATRVSYQWYRCDAQLTEGTAQRTEAPEDLVCAEIAGATGASYRVTVDDRGKFLVGTTTGSNSVDTITQWTNSTLEVQFVPVATTLPSVSGTRVAGENLTADPGIWDGAPAITYQWLSCSAPVTSTVSNVLPSTCDVIDGATAETYTQQALVDDARYITAQVIGTTGSGSSAVTTSYVVEVQADQATARKPRNTSAPSIRVLSLLAVGESILADEDTWDASPSFTASYQWYECTTIVSASSVGPEAPAGCRPIDGATSKSFAPTRDQAGETTHPYLMAAITASNLAGQTTAYSASTVEKVAADLVNDSQITVSVTNDALMPTTITGTPGVWEQAGATISARYYWLSCPSPITSAVSYEPDGCVEIDGVTGSSFTVSGNTDVAGRYVTYLEDIYRLTDGDTRPRLVRTRLAASTPMIKEAPSLWVNAGVANPPTVSKYPVVNSLSSGFVPEWTRTWEKAGAWRGSEVGTFAFLWFACDAVQETYSTGTTPVGCEPISGATAQTIIPTTDQLNKFLSLRVTASNSVGSFSVWTATSNSVAERPSKLTSPEISNQKVVNEVITVTAAATWRGTPTPTVTTTWYTCSKSSVTSPNTDASCLAIEGATGESLTLTRTVQARAFGSSVVTTVNLAGRYIVVGQSARNLTGAPGSTENVAYSSSLASAKILEKPYLLSALTMAPVAHNVGQTLVVTSTSPNFWGGTNVPSVSYRWFACDTAVNLSSSLEVPAASCALIDGAVSNTFTLTSAQNAKYVIAQMIGTNASGIAYTSSVSTAAVREAVRNTSAPSLSGNAAVGEQLTATSATWTGYPTPTPTTGYAWYACATEVVTVGDSAPAECTLIGGSTGSNFTPTENFAGMYILVVASASNYINTTTGLRQIFATKASSSTTKILRPAEVTSISNFASSSSAHVGSTITAPAATVVGFEAPTLDRQWFACDAAIATTSSTLPSGCVEIAGATGGSLNVPSLATAKYLAIAYTARNTVLGVERTSFKVSSSSARVTASPVNTEAPTIATGEVIKVGSTLSASGGSWTSFPTSQTLSYSWYSCDSSVAQASAELPQGCTVISGATSATFSPTDSQAGKHISAAVRATVATNKIASDSATKFSATVGQVLQPAAITSTPQISGFAHLGEVLTAIAPSVIGVEAPEISNQWYLCDYKMSSGSTLPSSCALMTGETGAELNVPASAVGKYLTVEFTASNSTSVVPVKAASASTLVVTATPSNSMAPVVSGSNLIKTGTVVSVTTGNWLNAPGPSYSYKWYSCDSAVETAAPTLADGCAVIPGATASSYSLANAQAGKHVLAAVMVTTASNKPGAGSATHFSASIGEVLQAPSFTANPGISGTAHNNETLTLVAATASGVSIPVLSYQWFICETSVEAGLSAMPSDCALDELQTTDSYELGTSVTGKFVAVLATATNSAGVASVTSASTLSVSSTPVNTASPFITGSAVVSSINKLTISNGTWVATPAVASTGFTYQWYSCETEKATDSLALGAGCELIAGQTSSTYTPIFTDQGKYLLARVTASNTANKTNARSASWFTASIGPILVKPISQTAPSISSTSGYKRGTTVVANLGTWSGTSGQSYVYNWYSCTSTTTISSSATTVPASCTAIVGFDNRDLIIPSSLSIGRKLFARVIATNAAGDTVKFSNLSPGVK